MSICFLFKTTVNPVVFQISEFAEKLYNSGYRSDPNFSKNEFIKDLVNKMNQGERGCGLIDPSEKVSFFIFLFEKKRIELMFEKWTIYDDKSRVEVKKIIVTIIEFLSAKFLTIVIDDGTTLFENMPFENFKKSRLSIILGGIGTENSPE